MHSIPRPTCVLTALVAVCTGLCYSLEHHYREVSKPCLRVRELSRIGQKSLVGAALLVQVGPNKPTEKEQRYAGIA